MHAWCVINFFTWKRPGARADTGVDARGAGCTIENANARISHVEGPSGPRGGFAFEIYIYHMLGCGVDLLCPHTHSQWAAARCRARGRAQRPRGAADPYESSNELLFIIYVHAESALALHYLCVRIGTLTLCPCVLKILQRVKIY